jgi:hypothetical protein
MITIEYLVSIRNNEIPTWLANNGSLYNKIHTKPIETLKGNHYNDFKAIHVSFGGKKNVIIDPNVEVLVNLISRTHFHSVVTIKWLWLDLGGDPPNP